jgi:hypothetical protein
MVMRTMQMSIVKKFGRVDERSADRPPRPLDLPLILLYAIAGRPATQHGSVDRRNPLVSHRLL